MMEEDTEVLDWGNEDDENMMVNDGYRATKGALHDGDSRRGGDTEDAEDAVSLGGDDDDVQDYYSYQSRSQQDAHKGIPLTPKAGSFSQQQQIGAQQSHREVQRENSANSQKQFSQSQASSQSSPQRSQSFSKIIHSLPPKPVVSNVPFLHPAHPSIIEATAMATRRSDREKKANSGAVKPASSGEGSDPLPPDWETRHPRSGGRGVYYYNIRTHESTWIRPTSNISSSQDKDSRVSTNLESRSAGIGGFDTGIVAKTSEQSVRRPDAEAQALSSILSYEDRHYRPPADATKPHIESNGRDSRISSHRKSTTPPASPKMERTWSPGRRGREQDSQIRSSSGNRGQLRNGHRDEPRQVSPAERQWVSPRDTPAIETPNSQTVSSQLQHGAPNMPSSPMTPDFEDRNPSQDADWLSGPRHRSPPRREPQLSYDAQASQSSVATPQPTSHVPRMNTRFDRPAKRPQQSATSQSHDYYSPADDTSQRRDRESAMTSSQVEMENNIMRMRVDDHASGVISNRNTGEPLSRTGSLTERSISTSSPSPAITQAEQSRIRKRPPLPPQSTRFLEASKPVQRSDQQPPLPPPPPPASVVGSPSTKDIGSLNQRTTNTSVPSGPRFQPQPTPPTREITHVHPVRGSRVPPSGPSATNLSKSRPNLPPAEPSAAISRESMDIDSIPPPSRAPSLRMNDLPIRAGSGMYADREPVNSDLPKGPRAMSIRSSSNVGYSPPTTSASSSTIPFPPQRVPDFAVSVSRPPSHSPPVYRPSGDAWAQSRDQPERHTQPNSASWRRDSGGWGPDVAMDRDSQVRPHTEQAEDERFQQRREPSDQSRRQSEFSRPPPQQPSLSSTNSVPIGHRKVSNSEFMPSTTQSNRYGPSSGGRSENSHARMDRDNLPLPDSYERHQHIVPRVSPMDNYRPLTEVVMSAQRRRSFTDESPPPSYTRGLPSPVDNFQNVAARPRRDTYSGSRDQSHFEQHLAPREWKPREAVAPRHQNNLEREIEYRATSPRPASRESSNMPPPWEASSYAPSDRTNVTGRLPEISREPNRPLFSSRQAMELEAHSNRPPKMLPDREVEHFNAPENRRGGMFNSLEGRLSERYDHRHDETIYRPHGLPPNPILTHRNHESFNSAQTRSSHFDSPRPLSQSFHEDHFNALWLPDRDRARGLDTQGLMEHEHARGYGEGPSPSFGPQESASRMSKPIRIRRPRPDLTSPLHQDDYMRSGPTYSNLGTGDFRSRERSPDGSDMGIPRNPQRPPATRRGGSLLDRLSLGLESAPPSNGISSQSLRDRVQVPAKRDIDEMMEGDTGVMDTRFDIDDEAAEVSRRNRRRGGKLRRSRGTARAG